MLTLDVAIATLGREGIMRTAAMNLPKADGVSYVVSWQCDDNSIPIPPALMRDDISIHRIPGKGVSLNRNNALSHCNADIILCADDDLIYTPEGLKAVIDAFESHPEIDYATFRYSGSDHRIESEKRYPESECLITGRLRNFCVCSFEIAIRRKLTEQGMRFDTRFGPGSTIANGEDEMFFLTLKKKGFVGRFFPVTITHHNGLSTGFRKITDPSTAEGMGTVIGLTYPFSAPLRIPLKALRMGRSRQMPAIKALYRLTRGWLRHLFITPPWKII